MDTVTILGIDPGPKSSGVVLAEFTGDSLNVVQSHKDLPNNETLDLARASNHPVAIEAIECLYAHVGKETVKTIRFVGNLEEAADLPFTLSPQQVKQIVCDTAAAKDPAVRQALIDRFGPQGTKNNPGPTFGVASHAWRALAVATAVRIQSLQSHKTRMPPIPGFTGVTNIFAPQPQIHPDDQYPHEPQENTPQNAKKVPPRPPHKSRV